MGKVNFRFVARLENFKHNIGIRPLGFVLNKVKVVVQNMPDDFLAGYEFGDFEGGTVNILVLILKFSIEFIRVPLNCLLPPTPNIVDGSEGFFRTLVYCKARAVMLIHVLLLMDRGVLTIFSLLSLPQVSDVIHLFYMSYYMPVRCGNL